MTKSQFTRKVNRLGDLVSQIKVLEKEAEELRKEVLAENPPKYFETATYGVSVYEGSTSKLDRGAVLDALGFKWVAEHTAVTTYTGLRIRALPVAEAA